MSYVKKRRRFGKTLSQSPSRFLDAIPEGLLRSLDTAKKAASEEKVQSMFAQIQQLLGKK